jgi:hypothetical protein
MARQAPAEIPRNVASSAVSGASGANPARKLKGIPALRSTATGQHDQSAANGIRPPVTSLAIAGRAIAGSAECTVILY